MEKLGVVVVNYGSSELLAQNLVPLARNLPDAIIIVVDNRTDDAERNRVTALAESEGWQCMTPDTNLGFGAGMNAGVDVALRAGARHLLLLNPDASIGTHDVGVLSAEASRHPLTLLCPRIVRPDGSAWFTGADLHLDDGRVRNMSRRAPGARIEPWLTGACLLVTREIWERVGGFDPDYFLYWEDIDLSHRVLAAGGSLLLVDDAVAVHAEGGTQGDGHATDGLRKSDTYYYYSIRNRLLFAAKHLDDAGLRTWSRNARTVAFEVLLQGGRRQFLRSPGILLVALRALRDGRRMTRTHRAPDTV